MARASHPIVAIGLLALAGCVVFCFLIVKRSHDRDQEFMDRFWSLERGMTRRQVLDCIGKPLYAGETYSLDGKTSWIRSVNSYAATREFNVWNLGPHRVFIVGFNDQGVVEMTLAVASEGYECVQR